MSDEGSKGPEPPKKSDDELTQIEKDKIAQWFAANVPGGHLACPICKTENWAVLDHFVTPTVVGGPKRNSMQLGSVSYPHFMLACLHCGNVQFVNALRTGVLPSTPEGEKK